MRRRFTNKSIHWRGNTTVVTVRVPNPVVAIMDRAVGKPDLPDRSAVAQDALALWSMLEERDDGQD